MQSAMSVAMVTAEAVDKDGHLLAVVFGKLAVDGRAVEVVPSDVALQCDVVCGLRHVVAI